jgi:hypothetical protein
MNNFVYQFNDVFITAGNTRAYEEMIGNLARAHTGFQQVMGTFSVRRLAGRWPRAVNLWESTWSDLAAALPHHDPGGGSVDQPPSFGAVSDAVRYQREGGWDRFLMPAPGSPDLAALRVSSGEDGPRPCVVQLVVTLRDGMVEEYLQWLIDSHPVAAKGWSPLMWFSAVHGPQAFVYFAGPTWTGLEQLAASWPPPPGHMRPSTETWLLEASPGSLYLQPPD